MTAEDVTDAMVSAADFAMGMQPGREHTSVAQMRAAIAAAINASGCVLVPRCALEAVLALAGVPLSHPQRPQYDEAVRQTREAMGMGSMEVTAPQPGKE